MRTLLAAVALLGASCATPLAFRLERNDLAGEHPIRAVTVPHSYFPTLPPLGIGTEMEIASDEVGLRFGRDPRPLVFRLTSAVHPLPIALPAFEGFERRAAFVPAIEARVQTPLEK